MRGVDAVGAEHALAVWVGRVVGKASLVALARGIDDSVLIEVEEVAVVLFVVDASSSVCLLVRDHLACMSPPCMCEQSAQESASGSHGIDTHRGGTTGRVRGS